jgi:EmrB/QacA subfamily drug resistance transporter
MPTEPAAPTTGSATARSRRLTLLVCCLALFMVLVDATIVNVALPTIQRRFTASIAGLQWILDAYTLVYASLLLSGGALGDRHGHKRLLLAGFGIFAAGSALAGAAPNLTVLITARALQATGAAAASPATLSLLTAAYPDPRERARVLGIWSGVGAMSLTAGLLVGGLLVDGPGWRWIFLVNLPVAAVLLPLAARVLPHTSNPRPRRLDLPGQVLGTGVLALGIYAVIEGGTTGWTSPPILASFAAATVLLAAFLAVEARRPQPLLELGLFRHRPFVAANLLVLLAFFATLGFALFHTLYFQQIRGDTALTSALRTLPVTMVSLVIGPPAGRLAARRGAALPVALGTLLAGTGLLTLLGLDLTTPYATIWWRYALFGTGIGLIIAPLTQAAMAGLPPTRAGVAAGTLNTSRQVGAALGIAVLGALLATQFRSALPDHLSRLGLPASLREQLTATLTSGQAAQPGAVPGGPGTAGALRRAVGEAFMSGAHTGWAVAALALLASSLLTITLLPRSTRIPPSTPTPSSDPHAEPAAPASPDRRGVR